jgi:membrane-bound lytic murein transglycosylase D
MIQRILDEEGVPQELIHLAQAESGFFARAVSRMRAAGMWQFMAFRGVEYGLTQTKFTDDRLDPEKSTRAAARHLRDLYERFGDWYLAMAAYNCGPLVVEQAIQRTGYADFWELRRRGVLPRETANYVPVIVAMTIMAKNPAEYGLQDVRPQPAWDYETAEITAPTSLALVADLTESTPGQLQTLNPSLLKAIAPAGCDLRVPRGTASSLVKMLPTVPPESRISWRVHRVEHSDTLATIGRRYATDPNSIATVNKLPSQEVAAGDLLVVPAIYREPRPAAPRKVVRKQSGKQPAQSQRLAKSGAPVKPRAAAKPGTKRPASLGQTASNHRTPATSKTVVRR